MKRVDFHVSRFAPFLCAIVALTVYVLTLAPSLTWSHWGADGGDFVTAAVLGRMPHPPGFPMSMVLARVFVRVLNGDPAWRLNLLSAVMAAATVGVTVATLLRQQVAVWAAVVAGLCLAFSPLFWSQALITEVYSTAAFFVALALWVAEVLRARVCRGGLFNARTQGRKGTRGDIFRNTGYVWLGITWGLGIAVHPTLFFLGPVWLGYLWLLGNWRSRFEAGLWLGAGLCLGLLPYALLPYWSDWPQPWGDLRTWRGWWDVVSANIYWGYAFGVPLAEWPGRILSFAGLLVRQFTPVGAFLVVWGVFSLGKGLGVDRQALTQRRRGAKAQGLGFMTAVAVLVVYVVGYRPPDAVVYFVPLMPLLALWLGMGVDLVLSNVASLVADLAVRLKRSTTHLGWMMLVLPALLLLWHLPVLDLHRDDEVQVWLGETLADVPRNAVLRSHGDQYSFALWYAQAALGLRPDVLVVEGDLWAFDFYRAFMYKQTGQTVQSPEDFAQRRPWCVLNVDSELDTAEVVCP